MFRRRIDDFPSFGETELPKKAKNFHDFYDYKILTTLRLWHDYGPALGSDRAIFHPDFSKKPTKKPKISMF